MALVLQEDECPVCQTILSEITDGSEEAKESHVQSCIESHASAPPTQPAFAYKTPQSLQARVSGDEGESCPICHTSYLTKEFDGSDSAREVHFATCFESQSSSPKFAMSSGTFPLYNKGTAFDSNSMSPEVAFPSEKGAASTVGPTTPRSATMPMQAPISNETPSSSSRRFSIFGFGSSKEEKVMKADNLIRQRWGPPGSPTSEMVRRYWMATRMQQHWEYLRAQHPKRFKKYLDKGYMEPIPVCTISKQSLPFSILA